MQSKQIDLCIKEHIQFYHGKIRDHVIFKMCNIQLKYLIFNSILLLILLSFYACNDNKIKDASQKENGQNHALQNEPSQQTTDTVKKILFFGNSITAGYGTEQDKAFPALIQKKLDSAEYNYKVINAGVSGETTSGGLSRIAWVLEQEKPDILVLELGANDGLRGKPVDEIKSNLQSIIDTIRAKDPGMQIILAGMKMPPNLGKAYTQSFYEVFKQLHQKNKTGFIPFILKGVASKPELNQGDGIHPTARGHKVIAKNVWKVLQKHLHKKSQNP